MSTDVDKKILVTGCGGMLGSAVVPYFKKIGYKVIATSRRKNVEIVDEVLDVTMFDLFEEKINQHKPDMIFHLAAETSLEYCEDNPDKAFNNNTIGIQNAALLSKKYNIELVYISTAGVFNGLKSKPYDEFDTPDPIMIYGKSKYEGEKLVKMLCDRFYIVRAGWMIGGIERDKKFVSLIVEQLANNAKKIYAVNDKIGSPTFAPLFAKNLENLIRTGFYGIYHMTSEGYDTRYDVAKEIIKILGLTNKVELISVSSDFFSKNYYVPRPPSESMRNYNLALRGINNMGDWRHAIVPYVKELFHQKRLLMKK